MLKAVTYLVFFLLISSQGLQAQAKDYANGLQLTGMAQLGLPQNEFEEAYASNLSGIAASVMLPVGKSRLIYFGGEYSWNSMGKEKSSVEIGKEPSEILAGDMTVSSEVRSYQANMRFSPLKGPIRIYFDVLFGMKFYSSDTEILIEEVDGTELLTRNSLNNENTNFAGFAGGLMLALSRNFFIDAKLQSLQGGEVKYVDQSTLDISENGELDYEVKTTPTDLLVPQVGLSIVF